MGVAIGDIDADGALDILKTHFADDIPALYRNRGRGLFEDVAVQAGLGVQNRFVQWGAGLPDLDNDGWMDVFYVTGNVYPEIEAKLPGYPHRSPRIVFRNTGGGRFLDVTASSGRGVTTPQSSRGAAFGDIDQDGDVDALVMNMNAPPSLLRNDRQARPPLAGRAARGRPIEPTGHRRHGPRQQRRPHAGACGAQPDELLLGRRSRGRRSGSATRRSPIGSRCAGPLAIVDVIDRCRGGSRRHHPRACELARCAPASSTHTVESPFQAHRPTSGHATRSSRPWIGVRSNRAPSRLAQEDE